jgi:hypothetical protein
MKEDILEQIVDGYFLRKPSTFTKHNLKYIPDLTGMTKEKQGQYRIGSDIDILAIQLIEKGKVKVSVISCKSYQKGFNIKRYNDNLSHIEDRFNTREGTGPIWKKFRELVDPIWAKAFREEIYQQTLSRDFTYYIAVTKVLHKESLESFCNQKEFLDNLSDNGKNKVTIKFLTLEEIFYEIYDDIKTTPIESSEVGRMIQLLKAAGLMTKPSVNKK